MTRRIDAIYENGVIRPLEELRGVPENTRLTVEVRLPDSAAATDGSTPFAGWAGIMPDEDADELREIIAAEFERVDPRDWQ